MYNRFIYLIIYIGAIFSGCGQRPASNNPPIPWDSVPLVQQQKRYSMPPSLVTVDLNEELPTQHLKIELKELKYVALETTPTLHLDKDRRIKYLSDNYCGIANLERAEVFIFNLVDGKCVGHLNHKGPGPYDYPFIAEIMIDEKAKEIFVLTRHFQMVVYSFDGKYQRRFNLPAMSHNIINFNDTVLLVSGEQYGAMDDNSVFAKTPYLLVSKRSGEVITPLDITLKQRVSIGGFYINTPNMFKDGKDIYLSNLSSDTLYHIEQDGKPEPFLVRTPSVFGKKPQMLFQIYYKLGSYLLLEKTVKEIIPNRPEDSTFKSELYVLDLETGKISKSGVIKIEGGENGFAIDLKPGDFTANTLAVLVNADEIIDGVKNGEYKSDEIKQVASKLNEEDNPVLVILKY